MPRLNAPPEQNERKKKPGTEKGRGRTNNSRPTHWLPLCNKHFLPETSTRGEERKKKEEKKKVP